MAFPIRQKWAESFGKGKQLWLLASAGDAAMYYTKDDPNDDPRGRSPLYHVWNGDKWLFTGASRAQAERAYAEARKDNIPKV